MPQVKRLGIAGASCAGKSTAVVRISEKIPVMTGWDVYRIPESFTTFVELYGMPLNDIFKGGDRKAVWEAERLLIQNTVGTCNQAYGLAQLLDRNSLILIDKPVNDYEVYFGGDAYGEDQFRNILWEACRLTREGSFALCDAVIKLTTAAKGAERFFTNANNSARRETLEEARRMDDLLEGAYNGHGHLRIIDNSTDFEGKMNRVIREVCHLLGFPEPLEIERKYRVEAPDLAAFPVPVRTVFIEQAYVMSEPGEEQVRIRRRSTDGVRFTYYRTEKRHYDGVGQRIEIEKEISWREYHTLLCERRDPLREIIVKDRHCFAWAGQYFELDAFRSPAIKDNLLEVELTDIAQDVVLPPFIKVLEEVTDDPRWTNWELSQRSS